MAAAFSQWCSTRTFFIMMLALFEARTQPASSKANPPCIIKMPMTREMTHAWSFADIKSIVTFCMPYMPNDTRLRRMWRRGALGEQVDIETRTGRAFTAV